jgi:hypothetical protein
VGNLLKSSKSSGEHPLYADVSLTIDVECGGEREKKEGMREEGRQRGAVMSEDSGLSGYWMLLGDVGLPMDKIGGRHVVVELVPVGTSHRLAHARGVHPCECVVKVSLTLAVARPARLRCGLVRCALLCFVVPCYAVSSAAVCAALCCIALC